jgi:Right handed beta helix region
MDRSLLTTKLLTSLLFVATAGGAHALTLHVNCGQQTGLTTIGAAIKVVQSFEESRPVTVLIGGQCRENVVIRGIDRLTLTGVNGASISDASGGKLDVIYVQDSRDVSINAFTINAGADGVSGSNGVNCDDVSVCRLSHNVIQGALDGFGFLVNGEAVGRLNGDILQGNFAGVGVFTSSKVTGDSFTARNNTDFGIEVERGEAIFNNCTIEMNSADGAFVRGRALFHSNGCSFSKNGRDGIRVLHSSFTRVRTAIVTANAGAGVFLQDLSMAHFDPPSTVTGNHGGTDVVCGPQYTATRGALTNIGGGTTNCVEP